MVDVYVAAAFSKDDKGGNKAGVVLGRSELTSVQKVAIAKEMGYSETAFVLDSDKADFKLQYFTPTEEVPLCGHATIAAFSTLKLLNMLDKPDCTIETEAGILNIHIKDDGLILMEQNRPTYLEVLDSDIFTGCIERNFIDHRFPNETVINFEWLYGRLESGRYRIVKTVTDFRGTGDYTDYTYMAEFCIKEEM